MKKLLMLLAAFFTFLGVSVAPAVASATCLPGFIDEHGPTRAGFFDITTVNGDTRQVVHAGGYSVSFTLNGSSRNIQEAFPLDLVKNLPTVGLSCRIGHLTSMDASTAKEEGGLANFGKLKAPAMQAAIGVEIWKIGHPGGMFEVPRTRPHYEMMADLANIEASPLPWQPSLEIPWTYTIEGIDPATGTDVTVTFVLAHEPR